MIIEKVICNWCGQPTQIIWVHGHGQCAICGGILDECCTGEISTSNSSPNEKKKAEIIKHICFDLDGTLVDSSKTIFNTTKAALEQLKINVTLPELDFVGMIGKHFSEIFESLKVNVPDFGEFITVYKKIYFDFIDDSTLFPGVNEVFEYLKEKKIQASLLTTKAQDQADTIADYFNLIGSIEMPGLNYIMGRRDGIAHKPSPEPLLMICDELNITPAETMIVGDTELDIRCGKNAGAKTCGVLYGYRTREQIEKEKPDHIINELKDLLMIIE